MRQEKKGEDQSRGKKNKNIFNLSERRRIGASNQ
jgi:hypothetical protein